ncbi:MAG TPA: C25 family cysteine peptidase [Bacteroidales bacterium]|nr:C25 family cysteine peptidase [Bacteroidales bacterium]
MGLGKGKWIVIWEILFLVSITSQGQTKSIRLNTGVVDPVRFTANRDGSIVIDYRLPEIFLTGIVNDYGKFYRIDIPGHTSTSDAGEPELPVFTRMLNLPENSSCRIRITGVKREKIKPAAKKTGGLLFPAQGSQTKRIQQEKPAFRMNRSRYESSAPVKRDTVKIEYLGKARDSNIGNLIISPVSYYPKSNTLEIITSMTIEIRFTDPAPVASDVRYSTLYSGAITRALSIGSDVIPDYTNKPVGMIILTDTIFRKQLQPFIRWKTQKGFRVTVLYKGAKFAGTTAEELKQSVQNIYNSATADNPVPDYLLIVGDISIIPCFGNGTSSNYTDLYYCEFTGNGDYIPEMYTGRIPARDTGEVRTTLNKIISNEKFEFSADNDFYKRSLATAGYDPNNTVFMNGQVKYLVTNYLTASNRIAEKHFYSYTGSEPESNLYRQKDSIIKIINQGVSFINYSGHGNESGWEHLNISVNDTSSIKNQNRYPVVISNACRTSSFNISNSFGNRLVLEGKRGAVAFIGCSNDSYWTEDYYWTIGLGSITENPVYEGKNPGAFDRLFHTHNESPSEWYYTLGQINYAGNMSVSTSTSAYKKYYWETYNIVGDPSMIPILGEPKLFSASIPDTVPNSLSTITFAVEPFAYAAISHADTICSASFTGISGGVTLNLPALTDDSCMLVITGQNRIPLIRTIHFADLEKEFLNFNAVKVNDPYGNNNNKADFSEEVYLSINLGNMGLSDAKEVYAKLSSSSDLISIEYDSVYIGTVLSRTNIVIPDKLRLKIADEVPDMKIVTFDLLIGSTEAEKHYPLEIMMHSPDLLISGFAIDDTRSGNGDHVADPGEIIDLIFRIKNNGSSDASGDFMIETANNYISIIEPGVNDRIFKSGQTEDITLKIEISDAVSSGNYIDILSKLISNPFNISKNFTFRIGKTRESFESGSFSIFPWINISRVPWIITEGDYYDGTLAARSGIIANNESTSLALMTYYLKPDTLKFWYKISSEVNYDYLSFLLNGKEMLRKSGETGWLKACIPVEKGANRIEWIYKKDDRKISGSDCVWIDMIDFSNSGTVNYICRDLEIAKIITPIQKNHLGLGYLNVKVVNTGKDTINGFNLAYQIEDEPPVKQKFKDILVPGTDSTNVIFTTKADLSRFGNYKIWVYGYENTDDYTGNDTLNIDINNIEIEENIILYPNPVIDEFNVFINSRNSDRMTITISNSAGVNVYSIKKDIVMGGNTILIPEIKLASATYYLNIRGSAINKTISFVKLK